MNTKPFPYQRKGVLRIDRRFDGRALLADEMGLGKSLQALMFAYVNPEIRPIVIVCPLPLKFNWEREALVHFGWRSCILEGTNPRRTAPWKNHQIYIINYDILHKWIGFFKGIKPQLVIGDEIQYIKARPVRRKYNRRVKAFLELCKRVPHVISISGTPMVNNPSELFNIVHLTRPDIFSSWPEYAETYCDPKWTRWGMDYSGAKNLGQLHHLLKKTCMVRRRKKDVLKDLPSKTRSVVPMPMKGEKEYRAASDDFLKWLWKISPAKAKKAEKAVGMTRMGYLMRLAAQLKVPFVIDWIEDFFEETGEKLVLFGRHKKVLKPIYKHFKDKAVLITGETTGRKRQRAVDSFNHDSGKRILVGNIDAAGVGINITSTSTIAFAEMAWTPGQHTQAEDRIHGVSRGKKGHRATYYYLVAHQTIEEVLCELVQKKQGILERTLDGEVNGRDFDIYTQVLEWWMMQRK